MASFGERLKRGLRAAAKAWGPSAYEVEGKKVICPHCGESEFAEGTALVNSFGMSFIGLDWADKTAHTLMCAGCGRIEWYGQRPDRI